MWALLTEKFRWEPLGNPEKKNMQGWMGRWDAEMLNLEKVEHT